MKENNSLTMAVIPQAFLIEIKDEINQLKTLLSQKNEETISEQWIASTRIPKILSISIKTWQTYRDKRIIPFSQFGGKIYVKRSDLDQFMQDHYIESRKTRR